MEPPMPPQPPPGWLSPPPTVPPSPEPKRATHPPPPPKKMELDNSERSRSPHDTGEKDVGNDDKVNGDRLADHVCRMIISADDTVDEAASGGRDSATKSIVNVADYMVSFMNFV